MNTSMLVSIFVKKPILPQTVKTPNSKLVKTDKFCKGTKSSKTTAESISG